MDDDETLGGSVSRLDRSVVRTLPKWLAMCAISDGPLVRVEFVALAVVTGSFIEGVRQ